MGTEPPRAYAIAFPTGAKSTHNINKTCDINSMKKGTGGSQQVASVNGAAVGTPVVLSV